MNKETSTIHADAVISAQALPVWLRPKESFYRVKGLS
jgi:hypothetical protein